MANSWAEALAQHMAGTIPIAQPFVYRKPFPAVRFPTTPLQLLAQAVVAFGKAGLPAIAEAFQIYLLALETSSEPGGHQMDAVLGEAVKLMRFLGEQEWRSFAEQRLKMCVLRVREEDEEARANGRKGWGCVGLLGEDLERFEKGEMG